MSCLYKAVVLYLSVFIAICEALGSNDYEVPTPTVEALYPRGFRITLKDDGYTFVGFRLNINQDFQELDESFFQRDIFIPKGKKWVYRNRDVVLKVGDTIFYLIYVLRKGKVYDNTDPDVDPGLCFNIPYTDPGLCYDLIIHRFYKVAEFVNEDDTPANGQTQIRPSPTRLPRDTSLIFHSLPKDTRHEEAQILPSPSTRLPQSTSFFFHSLLNDTRHEEAQIQPSPSTTLPQDTSFFFHSLPNDTRHEEAQISPSPSTRLPQSTSFFFHSLSNDTRYEDITVPSDCAVSKTKVRGIPNICKDQLLFSEEFAKTSLRQLDEWDAMIQFPGEPDYPFNVYIPDNTVSFEEDSLVITPVLSAESQYAEGFLDLADRCTGQTGTPECRREVAGAQTIPPVTTAKITTRSSFNFMFGRVEVRAKLPSGSWLLPEINLESSDNAYGPDNYESGLMRVAFVRGNPGLAKKLYGGPVLTESEPFRSALLQEKIGIDNWHKDFHNYTMIWRPDGIDLLVDGEQYGTVNPNGVRVGSGFFEAAKKNNVTHASRWQKGTVMAPLDKMFHITLGLRVGGVNDFSDDLEDKPWRNGASKAMLNFWRSRDSWRPSWDDASLRVDYVRVYAL